MSGTHIKLYKDEKLILDCTLCTNPEGRIGWWDAVEGKFHDETEIFLERAYREPIGTQYIDTGVKPENVRMTNADHIRSMTDEELAELLCTADWCEICDQIKEDGTCKAMEMDGPLNKHCVSAGLRWLKQPYKENA